VALHPGVGHVVVGRAFDVRGGADRPDWSEFRRRIGATLERDASVERALHDAVLALVAGLSAAVGATCQSIIYPA